MLDDAHDEGEEMFTLALSNASGAWRQDSEATGTIENADLMPAALLARFGRAMAEQVVQHIEERRMAPRERGFRARFAGQELRSGSDRGFALGFLSQFGQPMGGNMMGAAGTGASPMGAAPAGAHLAGPGAPGMTGMPGMANMARPQQPMGGASAMGAAPMGAQLSGPGAGMPGMMAPGGQQPPMGDATAAASHAPAGNMHSGGVFGSMLGGGDLFSNSAFELNREQHGGIVSLWSRAGPKRCGTAR